MSTSALKKRLAASQEDRVEELKAAGTPTGRRPSNALAAELEEATQEPQPDPAPVLTVVDAPVEEPQEAAAPRRASRSAKTAVAKAVGVLADTPVDALHATPITAPEAGTDVPPAETAAGEGWRRFVTPPAARGTAVHIRRLNVPVSEELQAQLATLDYQLKTERSRWVINRNDLVTAAGQAFLADPDGWEAKYLAARLDLPATPGTLQGRVTAELFDALDLARYTPTGKRPVGPVLGFIIDTLLHGA